jgi:hypothetical protein
LVVSNRASPALEISVGISDGEYLFVIWSVPAP